MEGNITGTAPTPTKKQMPFGDADKELRGRLMIRDSCVMHVDVDVFLGLDWSGTHMVNLPPFKPNDGA